jgi:hypothetical protein
MASFINSRDKMVSTIAANQSENPYYHHRLPFPFDAKINIMNAFGWSRGSDCRIVRFDLLALVREGGASHFLVETPTKIREKSSGGTVG